ncbi:MAG: RNA polymerase sigma factor [Archangium sp.]
MSSTKGLETEVLAAAPALFRLALRLTGRRAEAEDVVQDAFVKALSELRAGRFRGQSSLSTWLYRITVNVAFDRARSSTRRVVEPALEEPRSESPDDSIELRELREALAALPEDQRLALVLKELQGLTAREIAQTMERTEGAVEQLLVRARAELKRRFES